MKYARIHEGYVTEICTPIEGFTIEQCFHVSLVDQMTPCGDDVQGGWAYANGVFTAPVVVAPVEPAPVKPAPAEPAPVEPTAPTEPAPAPITDTPPA